MKTCEWPGCEREAYEHGWCLKHWQQNTETGRQRWVDRMARMFREKDYTIAPPRHDKDTQPDLFGLLNLESK